MITQRRESRSEIFLHMSLRSRVLRPCLTGLLLLTLTLGDPLGAPTARAALQTRRHEQIIVKIRNGNSGLPVWLASPYVFVGKTDPAYLEDSHRRTRAWGDARVDVTGADPREVRVWVDFIHRDCRFADGDNRLRTFDLAGNTLRGLEKYDLDLILTKGFVASNLCSTKTQAPEPGVLTIYVIPATFKELWDS